MLELRDQHAAPRPRRRRAARGRRRRSVPTGRGTWPASPCTSRWPAARTSPRCTASSTRSSVPDSAGRRAAVRRIWVSHLTDDELGPAAHHPRRLRRSARASAPTCGWATASALRVTRDRARRPPGRARRGVRLPRPQRPEVRPHRGRQRRYRPRHRPGGADGRLLASRPAPRPWPAAVSTPSASCARRSRIDGKQRLFAEPPHMQASMLFLPSGAHVPAVGDEVDVRVRYTATTFDRVVYASALSASRDQRTVGRGFARTLARSSTSRTSRDRVVDGPPDVADHDGDQVELAGHPEQDREPVELRVAAVAGRQEVAEVPPHAGEVDDLGQPARSPGRAAAAGRARRGAAARARTAASRPC